RAEEAEVRRFATEAEQGVYALDRLLLLPEARVEDVAAFLERTLHHRRRVGEGRCPLTRRAFRAPAAEEASERLHTETCCELPRHLFVPFVKRRRHSVGHHERVAAPMNQRVPARTRDHVGKPLLPEIVDAADERPRLVDPAAVLFVEVHATSCLVDELRREMRDVAGSTAAGAAANALEALGVARCQHASTAALLRAALHRRGLRRAPRLQRRPRIRTEPLRVALR
ncbi:MAG TPA: hypothetical protein VFV10_15700, partial [Gammaproteobacteria bacterium]|nr:hypothetical protein [Gammaproteobacteria bacterium]